MAGAGCICSRVEPVPGGAQGGSHRGLHRPYRESHLDSKATVNLGVLFSFLLVVRL